MLEKKQQRLNLLLNEAQNFINNIRTLSENLEQCKNQYQQLQGHINECRETINELVAENELHEKANAAIEDEKLKIEVAMAKTLQELNHGDINDEGTE